MKILLLLLKILNVGNRLDPELNIRPLIDLLFDPEYWPNIEYFLNSEAGSSYSPKFDDMVFQGQVLPAQPFLNIFLCPPIFGGALLCPPHKKCGHP